MFIRTEEIEEKKLIGCNKRMSFLNNKTKELWQTFMPKSKTISSRINQDLISLEVYPTNFFDTYQPEREFEKWAAVEVQDISTIPDGLQALIVPKGRYAVFLHKGKASEGPKTYNYIFTEWIPQSGYRIDTRPHFAVMGESYKQDDISSTEEIWIPISKLGMPQ